ncbi:hypothetical protein [Dickeya undicola]|uniref:Uncharacterized protein n=1 Tax=Dickeya undicola TaxID=1577887 RepID=A0A3N0GAU3_9GAMM|nr:hypothetical protein [Dickeya undicola]RNM09613.1 hypothetical protein EF878_01380 [Dickeya undicola]RNM21242.1 hypothetical protein EFS38_16255 [Dickeya undicola]
MTIFDSFLLAQLDVFAPFFIITVVMLLCFELSVSLRLLRQRQPTLLPIAIRQQSTVPDKHHHND